MVWLLQDYQPITWIIIIAMYPLTEGLLPIPAMHSVCVRVHVGGGGAARSGGHTPSALRSPNLCHGARPTPHLAYKQTRCSVPTGLYKMGTF